ncbi:MAG: FHA domain-containing protein [Phycisphaerae bacterium]
MAGFASIQMDVPEFAPQVRLLAQRGTPGQKNWTLQRVATLIGARRPAHIVLHDQGTEDAHCVILNIGSEVLLKDLLSETGTFHNDQRIDQVVSLSNGDIVRIAETRFDVVIEDAPEAREGQDGYLFPWDAFAVCIDDSKQAWRIESKVALVGRHESADVRLDHASVSERHAVVFQFLDSVAVFDTGSGCVWLNGERISIARLGKQDRILVGPYLFRAYGMKPGEALPTWRLDAFDPEVERRPKGMPFPHARRKRLESSNQATQAPADGAAPGRPPAESSGLAKTDDTAQETSAEPTVVASELEKRAAELDRRETEFDQKEAELDRREAELHCAEELLLQRWQQMVSARCRRCGAPVRMAMPEVPITTSPPDQPSTTTSGP